MNALQISGAGAAGQNVNPANFTEGRLVLVGASGQFTDSSKYTYSAVAGGGLTIASGTAVAAGLAAFAITRTNNHADVDTGVKWTFTDTTSAAGFLPFQILGGAAGTTNLFSVGKAGALTLAAGTLAAPTILLGTDTGTGWYQAGANQASYAVSGVEQFQLTSTSVSLKSTLALGWSGSIPTDVAKDTALSRISAGVIGVGTGAAGSVAGTLSVAKVQSGAASTLVLAYNTTAEITIGNATTTVTSLAGAGSRAVLADANGLLSAPVSERRLKKEIKPISASLDSVHKLKPVTFRFRDANKFGKQRYMGFIYDEAKKAVPEITGKMATGVGYVDQSQLPALLTHYVQQLNRRVKKLEARR